MKNDFAAKKYIKKYGHRSILLKNFVVVFLFVFIPFSVICAVTYSNSVKSLKNEEATMRKERVEKIASINDNFFMSMNRLSAALLENENVQFISNIEESRIDLSSKHEEIMDELNMFTLSYKYIQTICIYSELNKHIITPSMSGKLSENDNMKWIKNYLGTNKDFYADSLEFQGKDCIIVGRKKHRLDTNNSSHALIIIDKQLYMQNLNLKNDDAENFAVVEKDTDKLIFASAPDIKNEYKNKREVLISPSEMFGWDYYYFSDELYFNLANKKIIQNTVIIWSVLGFLCLLITIILSRRTFKPLKIIMEHISSPKGGEAEENKELIYNDLDELSYITRNILVMIDENEKLTDEIERRMLLLNNAQIYALQYQINPHFIFNTLETVKWLVIDIENENENEHTASEAILRLSQIVKYSLNMSNYLEDLDVEILNTKNYISVLKLRYEDVFDVVWQISEEAYKHKIVKLSLQPLIENAVYHGLKKKSGKGLIVIKAVELEGKMEISVTDNGVGMGKEELEQLRNNLDSLDVFEGVQVGLANLNQRIKLACGQKYGIEVESQNGFTVKINLP